MNYINNYTGWRKLYESSESIESVVSKLSGMGEIKKGDKDTDGVILLQTILKDSGVLTGKTGPLKDGVDGDFGGGTEGALKGFIGKTSFNSESDGESISSSMESTGRDYSNTIENFNTVKTKIEEIKLGPMIFGIRSNEYGKSIGIDDKSEGEYSEFKDLNLPKSGPIGDIHKSAWANLNVPTRGIPGSGNGNVGCAAAVCIMFYRATGLSILTGTTKRIITLGTATMWTYLTKKNKRNWDMIVDWRNDYQPGDIILTSRGSEAGHVGIVVDGGRVISNSSKGFDGNSKDPKKKGQILANYTIKGWEKIAKRNPQQTAIFRYKGDFLDSWGGKPVVDPPDKNDYVATEDDDPISTMVINLPEVTVTAKREDGMKGIGLPIKPIGLIEIEPIKPSEIKIGEGGMPDLSKK
jgi:peptidoglycan hydrolase-like protein with peptidoglycan-binding domain